VFVAGRTFQLSLMFVGKTGTYLNVAPSRRSTLVWAPDPTHKYKTMLEMPARNKHSSLLQAFVNYVCKKVYIIGPWKRTHSGAGRQKCSQCIQPLWRGLFYKTFYARKLYWTSL